MKRLDSLSPRLSIAVRNADETHRRAAVLNACLRAVSATNLSNPNVAKALQAIGSSTIQPHLNLRNELEDLSHSFDAKYFQLADVQRPLSTEAMGLFHKARAASALAFGLSHEMNEYEDAIYEAIMACDDRQAALIEVQEALAPRGSSGSE